MTEETKDIREDISADIQEIPEIPAGPSPEEITLEKRSMRRCFSRCGWATVLLTASTLVISLIAGVIVGVLEAGGIGATEIFNSNLLYFNEINLLPGMTAVSMFPRAMTRTRSFSDLLSLLIEGAGAP